MKTWKDIKVNDKFGRWVILGLDEEFEKIKKTKQPHRFICQCSCEQQTIRSVSSSSLVNGYSKSCGCLQKESAQKQGLKNAKQNKYDLTGEYGIGWTTNTNREFYFDLEDYDKIKNYCWRESGWGYCLAFIKNNKNNKTVLMQYIINPSDKILDHKNRNKMDNRKKNLRECSQQNNLFNTSKSGRNKSGVIGVRLNQNNKWEAQIGFQGKHYYLGSFDNFDDAVKVRLQAEKKYFKEFAPQKHLFEKYEI